MRRLLAKIVHALSRRHGKVPPSGPEHKLTAVEYEAVTLITYEGRKAHARACEQLSIVVTGAARRALSSGRRSLTRSG